MIVAYSRFIVFIAWASCVKNIQIVRGYGINECKGITVADCDLNDEYVVQKIELPIAIDQCQFFCASLSDCAVFQHKEDSCILLREDYRQDCKSAGGPANNPIDKCLEIELTTCDGFLEEDCQYFGDVLLEPSSIRDARHCQELCEEFQSVGCEYWTYEKGKCFLLTGSQRNCSTIGGPKYPNFNECVDLTTTTLPTTSTHPKTTEKPTTTKRSTITPTTHAMPTTTIPKTTTPPICSNTSLQIMDTFALENTIGNESYCVDVEKTFDTCSGQEWEFFDNKTLVVQHNNTNIESIGIGSEQVEGVNYIGKFNSTNADDDSIGIIFGYENSKNFFVLYANQYNVSNGYYKDQQFKIVKVSSSTGLNGPEMRFAIGNAASVPDQTQVLWKDNAHRGWIVKKVYTWRLKFRPSLKTLKLEFFEDSSLLFDTGLVDIPDITAGGKLGVFTHSQPNTFWYDMSYKCDNSKI